MNNKYLINVMKTLKKRNKTRYYQKGDSKNSKPYLIVTVGPTGSGKGSAPHKVQEYLKLKNREYVPIVIDDIVEKHPSYIQGVQEYIEYVLQAEEDKRKIPLSDKEKKQIITSIFSSPSQETIRFFNELYFRIRRTVDCDESSKTNISCDQYNDKLFMDALKQGNNIVYETTGEYWPSWLFTVEPFKSQISKYDVIFVYSVVDICNLISRNKSRAVQSAIEFFEQQQQINKSKNTSAPRLPDVRMDVYREKLEKIVDSFKKSIEFRCGILDNECIRFLIFDNRTRNSGLLYDSDESYFDKNNREKIDIYLNLSEKCQTNNASSYSILSAGKKRKTKKNKKTKKRKKH